MNWDVRPLNGIGPLEIGMTPKQVAYILDPLAPLYSRDVEVDGSALEVRTLQVPLVGYANDRVQSVDTRPHVSHVTFEGQDVYALPGRELLRLLEARNGGAAYGVGVVMFERLGLLVGGFIDARTMNVIPSGDPAPDEFDEHRTLTLWRPGAFDSYKDEFEPISFL